MNRVLIFFAVLLVCGCQPKNNLKNAIREFTQSEISFEIVAVDTFFASEYIQEAGGRYRELAELATSRVNNLRTLSAISGESSPPAEEDTSVVRLRGMAAKMDSLAKATPKKILWIDVETTLGKFRTDSAIQKITRVQD